MTPISSRILAVFTMSIALGLVNCASRREGPAGAPAGEVVIVSLQAEFHTRDDDKDERNGISETFTYNTKVIGENRSHHNNLRFQENSQNIGQLLVLSRDNQVRLSDLAAVTYRYIMDNDDGWNVVIRIN